MVSIGKRALAACVVLAAIVLAASGPAQEFRQVKI